MLSGCQYEVFNQVNHCVSDIKGCIFFKLWGIFYYCGTITREYSQGTPHSPFPFLRLKVLTGLVSFLLGDPTSSIYNSLSAGRHWDDLFFVVIGH